MKTTPPELIEWLNEELDKRNLSQSEASRRAGLNPGAISEIVNGTVPGLRVCKALAGFFNAPTTFVLQLAGHIEPSPGRASLPLKIRQFLDLIEALPESVQEEIANVAIAIAQSFERVCEDVLAQGHTLAESRSDYQAAPTSEEGE